MDPTHRATTASTTSTSSASPTSTSNPNPNTSASTSTPADRKRLTDRKAQRQRRERIKTYIARLEKTLEDLTASSSNGGGGVEATLLKQLEQQRAKTERLTGVISTIQGVLEGSKEVIADAGAGTATGAGKGTGIAGRSSISRNGYRRGNQSASSSKPSEPEAEKEKPASYTITPDLAMRISLHTQNPKNSGTRNYFEIVNETISTVSGEEDCLEPSTTDDDDDIAIRAILHGWDKVGDGYRKGGKGGLDRVWGLLQALDQGIFSQTGMVERVAVLRLMRTMIKWNLSPREHNIPSFMFPTVTQSMIPHAPIIDFFAWPNLRDHLIVSNINNITETTAALYVSQIRLKWPYELRDICRYNVAENRYTFSAEFDAVYYDLQSWTIGSPELQALIEAGPPLSGVDIGAQGYGSGMSLSVMGGGGQGEEGYWDRFLEGCGQI
ncbi:hypothetical protein BDV18DRAFT_138941, partial [Aspergillus unguis]